MNMDIKKKDVTIWVRDEYLSDPQVQEAIKGYGGICVFGVNAQAIADKFDKHKNLYGNWDKSLDYDMLHYYGEFLTRRQALPDKIYGEAIGDESSPYRLKELIKRIWKIGYSSYRTTLFTIPTKKSDINIRIPVLSPVLTLRILTKRYGIWHWFIWIDLKKNLYFCYPYRAFLEPTDKEKSWSFKPFIRIFFDWHIKVMLKFAGTYNKRVFVYGGDYDVTKDEFLERIKIINQYLK